MQIYEYGKIGEAVRAKIESTKQSIQGGASSSESFSDILRGYMTVESSETKVVSATGNYGNSSGVSSISGSTLLYALQNSDEDTTASAVLNMLGFSGYSSNSTSQLKTAADSLSDSAAMLISLNEAGAQNVSAVSDFVTDYNNLITRLSAESNSSAYLYRTAFSAALTAAGDKLAAAGITYDNGYISYNGQADSTIPDDFLTTVVSAASTVSSYASSVTADSDDSDSTLADYYTTLISSMI